MSKRLTTDEVQKKLDLKFNGLIRLVSNTWKNAATLCSFEDIEYGEWTTYLSNVMAKTCAGHPIRSELMRISQRTFTEKTIETKLQEIHAGVVSLVPNTYRGMLHLAKFIDRDYGEFEAFPGNVIHKKTSHSSRTLEKFKSTNKERYGVEFPMNNNELALKCAKSQKYSMTKLHWKTSKELICMAGWEGLVVDYLNQHHIDFEWQPKTFYLSVLKKTYRPDFYLVKDAIWVDIKGYHRKEFLLKWPEFQKLCPNSEIWDKKRLKQLDII